jgi:hypothetical protein
MVRRGSPVRVRKRASLLLVRPFHPAKRLSRVAAVLSLATWFLAAVPAVGAATVLVETSPGLGEVGYYTADAGEANELTITNDAAGFHFEDPGAVITPGSGCTAVSANEVTCEALPSTGVSVRVEDLDDFVSLKDAGSRSTGGWEMTSSSEATVAAKSQVERATI